MLETIAVLLFIGWIWGFIALLAAGNLIHILLVLCFIIVTLRLLRGERL